MVRRCRHEAPRKTTWVTFSAFWLRWCLHFSASSTWWSYGALFSHSCYARPAPLCQCGSYAMLISMLIPGFALINTSLSPSCCIYEESALDQVHDLSTAVIVQRLIHSIPLILIFLKYVFLRYTRLRCNGSGQSVPFRASSCHCRCSTQCTCATRLHRLRQLQLRHCREQC